MNIEEVLMKEDKTKKDSEAEPLNTQAKVRHISIYKAFLMQTFFGTSTCELHYAMRMWLYFWFNISPM